MVLFRIRCEQLRAPYRTKPRVIILRRGSGEAVRLLLVLTLARRILFLFAGVAGDWLQSCFY